MNEYWLIAGMGTFAVMCIMLWRMVCDRDKEISRLNRCLIDQSCEMESLRSQLKNRHRVLEKLNNKPATNTDNECGSSSTTKSVGESSSYSSGSFDSGSTRTGGGC